MIDAKKKLRLKTNSKTPIEHKKIPEIKEISKIRKKRYRNLFILFIFAIAVITTSYLKIHEDGIHELTEKRAKKFKKSIKRVEKRRHKKENCEQYALVAARSA